MRITFDPDADAAYIQLVDHIPAGGAPRQEICDVELPGAAVILDFSPEDMLIGIEVLGASRILPEGLLKEATLR